MSCPDEAHPRDEAAPVVVRADGLAVGYHGTPVVDGIDLDLRAGEALALVGTNGSGKSTLVKTLVGLLPVVGGRLTVLGREPGRSPDRVGYLGQFRAAGGLLALRAADVVRMGRFARRGLVGRLRREDDDLVRWAMARMGVDDLADVPLRRLSGGQQQRVHLAQVLARRPELYVLDEPTTGLDAASRERFLDVLDAERARGAAVVTATHDVGEALRCQHVLLLAQRVVACGRPAEVLAPDRLLEAFGVTLSAVPHEGHTDLVATETPHAH